MMNLRSKGFFEMDVIKKPGRVPLDRRQSNWLLIGRIILLTLALALPSVADERLVLTGSNRPFSSSVQLIGRAAPWEQVAFQVALKMRNLPELRKRIALGQILSVDELANRYWPTEADHDPVINWLKAEGITIGRVFDNHLDIFCSGSVELVERTLNVRFNHVLVEGAQYIATEDFPSIPKELERVILGVNNLQPYFRYRIPKLRSSIASNSRPFLVSDILNNYSAQNLGANGSGQTIAIVIDSFPLSTDLQAFWTLNGVSQSINNIVHAPVQGAPTAGNDTEGEATLDVEWASSIAPSAKVRIYASGDNQISSSELAYQQVLTDLKGVTIQQMSMSFGACEADLQSQNGIQSQSQVFASIAALGVAIFASSGDGGSSAKNFAGDTCNSEPQVEYPASDPSVTGVGGTTLSKVGGTETAWTGSGGGISAVFSRPEWQQGTAFPSGNMRLVPDVALEADGLDSADPGVSEVFEGMQTANGGTSFSSPAWAGFMALINSGRSKAGLGPLGSANGFLYPLLGTSNFRDITSGNNGLYFAGPGYDRVTGIGVPIMSNLYSTLVAVERPAQPTIIGFSPTSGPPGTTVTINGTNFNGIGSVSFNQVPAQFAATATQIQAVVPSAALTGPIEVIAGGGLATSTNNFTITAPLPQITSLSPSSGAVGSVVSINGLNFTSGAIVTFNGVQANSLFVFVLSASEITAIVPNGATTGPVKVTTPAGTATSPSNFTVSVQEVISNNFESMTVPAGIATDGSNNLWAVDCANSCFGALVDYFSSSGPLLASAALPGGEGSLALEQSSGNIWELESNGSLVAINPRTLTATQIATISTFLPADTSAVYDMGTSKLGAFPGVLDPQSATFGDFAIYNNPANNQIYLFLSALSYPGLYPFIMRVRIQNNTVIESKVVVASSALASTVNGLSDSGTNPVRGVGVNANGTVLTTLPIPVGSPPVSKDVPVTFGADYQLTGGSHTTSPAVIYPTVKGVQTLVDIQSDGIGTNSAGTFYLATGTGSVALDVQAGGAIFAIPPTLDSVTTVLSEPILSRIGDVTADNNNNLYATYFPLCVISCTNYIVKISGLPAPSAASLSIVKAHVGNFRQGQNGASYTVTVSNAVGAGPTSGTVTVTDTLPGGLTLVSMAGPGWTCPAGGTTCTRSDPLASGASYLPITVTVNVAANAPSSVTNQVSVSGAGAATASASDVTAITAPTFPAGAFTLAQGGSVNLGSSTLIMQNDGNLVLYQGGSAIWNTGTFGQNCGASNCVAIFQGDGNFVVYNGPTPLWNSGTFGNPGAQLVFSGQFPQIQIIGANQSVLWRNVTAFSAGNFTLAQGASFSFSSFSLVMQSDGNLVLYSQSGPVWSTGTFGRNCGAGQCYASFQADGSLVVHNGSTVLWSSGTSGDPGAALVLEMQSPQLRIIGSNQSVLWTDVSFRAGSFALLQGASFSFGSFTLVMQSDGNLVLNPQSGPAVWSTGTGGHNCGAGNCVTVFQGDGNLVVYDGTTPLWNSGTYGNSGANLVFSSQAPQMQIISGNSVLWAN